MSRLQMIPERAYMEIFRDLVDEYLLEVTEAFPGLLSSAAEAGLELAFWREAKLIAGDTLESMAREIIARENPFAVYDSKLSTKKQKEEAASVVKGMLKSKEKNLPEVLYCVIRSRFRLLADAFSEMLRNIICHRTKIADELFEGRVFIRIENISAGAGDYHCDARAAAIIETDCGKMVYKPRNCLTDVRTRIFAQKYFPGSVLIPKCYTDGSSFGVCEYLPADPDPETADPGKWFYALGGLTVLILLLGSSDMHNENIISSGGIPAVIDLETILTPRVETISGQTSAQEVQPCFRDEIRLSIWPSALLSGKINGAQTSVLFRMPVTVLDYSDEYFAGLEAAYRRCLEEKEELEKDVRELFADVPVRMIMRNTQNYGDLMMQLYKAGTLASEKAFLAFSSRLKKALMYDSEEEGFGWVSSSEAASVLRGDIPYFYTYGNCNDIYGDDGSKYGGLIRKTGIECSLLRISRMSEQELLFEKKLIKEAFDAESVEIRKDGKNISPAKDKEILTRSTEALSIDDAVLEAGRIMREIRRRMIKAPNGSCGWVGCHGQNNSLEIMQAGMFTGTTGIGLFAAAVAATGGPEELLEAARSCEKTAVYDLERKLETLKQYNRTEIAEALAGNLGESSGIAGLLRCLCLMNRYSSGEKYRELIGLSLDYLELIDISAVTDTDRIQGLSGIICVLCDYPEFNRTQRGINLVTTFANRLLELKQFQADGFRLWETVSERHMISGAGHGMAGIGAALYSAGSLLHDRRFLDAALDALNYEEQIYSEKLGTWPDNRFWPAQSYMHGYCSGAPGIGMMIQTIQDGISRQEPDIACRFSKICSKCAGLAEKSTDFLPLLYRDHLCCGNSAIAEYYLSTGKREQAGKILHSMFSRKEKTGAYMTTHPGYRNRSDLSLFYGITGIGYEMLRYAFPERVFRII